MREAALRLLYRLLFLLYAEDRDLLPVNREGYRPYSLRGPREEAARVVDEGRVLSPRAKTWWPRLAALFGAIASGDAAMSLPPYNGGLFDDAGEGGGGGGLLALPDAVLAPLLDKVSREDDAGGRRWINYRDLSVQQLGSIYERLLERDPVPDGAGEVVLRPNAFARKTSGSYYTPDELVRLILRRAGVWRPTAARADRAAEKLSSTAPDAWQRRSLPQDRQPLHARRSQPCPVLRRDPRDEQPAPCRCARLGWHQAERVPNRVQQRRAPRPSVEHRREGTQSPARRPAFQDVTRLARKPYRVAQHEPPCEPHLDHVAEPKPLDPLAHRRPAEHQAFDPDEAGIARDVDVETAVERRGVEQDRLLRQPFKACALCHGEARAHMGGRRVGKRAVEPFRGLPCNEGASASLKRDPGREPVAAGDSTGKIECHDLCGTTLGAGEARLEAALLAQPGDCRPAVPPSPQRDGERAGRALEGDEGLPLKRSSAHDRVVDPQHDDGADDRDDQTP